MIVETKTNKEYHSNGKIAYIENIAILSPISSHLYENRRLHPDGFEWIRTGTQAKYFDNGQIAWELKYDDMGKLIKNNSETFRKDGTTIIY